MFTRIILALVSLMLTSMALGAQLGVTLAVSRGSGGDTPFTALHTYYISPTGSDGNNGTSRRYCLGNAESLASSAAMSL